MLVDRDALVDKFNEGTPEQNLFYNYPYDVIMEPSDNGKRLNFIFPSFIERIREDFLETTNKDILNIIENIFPALNLVICQFTTVSTLYIAAYIKTRYTTFDVLCDIRVYNELCKTEDREIAIEKMESGLVSLLTNIIEEDPYFAEVLHTVALSYNSFFSELCSYFEIARSLINTDSNADDTMRIYTTKIGSSYYIPSMKNFMTDK